MSCYLVNGLINYAISTWFCEYACCLPGDRYMEEKQIELETEIINAAYNADITQSQARDIRHRRIQEANSFCTRIADRLGLILYCVIPHNTAF